MISLGLIGCGDVAETGHLPTILNDKNFRLAAVCDIDAARTRLFARSAGEVPAYTNWREMLAKSHDLDGVVLALPPEASVDVAIEALRMKLAVLDEKPLAATIADGRRLKAAVDELGGVYQTGFVLRYGDWVEQIRQLAPLLGGPQHINVEVYDELFDPSNLVHLARIQSFIKHSSAMTHEGSHVIDYVSLWNPSPWQRANAVAQRTNPNFIGPNQWQAEIELTDRSTLSVKIAWLLPEMPHSTVTIVGSEGRLDFDCRTGQGVAEINGVEETFQTAPLAPQWARQYQTFAAAIRRGRALYATVDNGLYALEATVACERSAQLEAVISRADLEASTDFKEATPAAESKASGRSPNHQQSR